jgi:hypothetical protein
MVTTCARPLISITLATIGLLPMTRLMRCSTAQLIPSRVANHPFAG